MVSLVVMSNDKDTGALERLQLINADAESGDFLERFDITRVPTSPGCYLMHDRSGHVVYVGKAANLRARIRSYLNESDTRYRVKFLMRRVADVAFLLTTTEKEALLLENSLIKKHKPRYNVRLKDDKTYVRFRLNMRHEFPRLTVVRQVKRDGSKYFGPYASADAARATLRQLQRLFPLRTCSDAVLASRSRPCLYHQMGQCSAPCVGYIEGGAYRGIVDQVVMVLEGRGGDLEKRMEDDIKRHAERLEFEEAAQLRDRLYALRKTLERQRTVQATEEGDRDVFGVYTQGRFSEIQALFFRRGKMTGGSSFSFNQREMPFEEILSSFLLQYYAGGAAVPAEILVPVLPDDVDALTDVLSEQRGKKVAVHCPQRGERRRLVELAERNARNSFEEKRLEAKANRDLVEQTKKVLHLRELPLRIECFDISTTQGDKAVGSMVTFTGGTPDKQRYRRYAIKHVTGQDDFAMMREVLMRRYQRAIDEDDLPQLVLIDGGKGQLGVATAVLKDLGIEDLEAASIAKSRLIEEGERSPERFFRPGRKNPIILPQNHAVVHFLARIRDEAHRFAITYHRKRRQESALRSPLVEIPGVGKKRAQRLLRELGSLRRVREASIDDIAALPGFSDKLARTIKEHLQQPAPGKADRR